jgi:hypothetical protein
MKTEEQGKKIRREGKKIATVMLKRGKNNYQTTTFKFNFRV